MRRRGMVAFGGAAVLAGTVLAEPPLVTNLGLLPGDLAIGPAENSQQEHSIAPGGQEFLVVWSDYRARSSGNQTIQSDGDILGIRLDAAGQPIDPAPFVVAGGLGLQHRPLAAWNGQNWLVTFISQDPVGGYFADQVRAVRVSPDAVVLDPVPILLPPDQFTPSTIGLSLAGINGQWLITRCVYHDSGYGTFLGGQRIDGDGTLLDADPIMLMDWIYGATRLIAAGDEYLIAGPDWNNGAAIRARRVGTDAQGIGAEFAVPSLNIAANGAELYITWIKDFVAIVGSRATKQGVLLNPAGTTLFSGQSLSFYHTNLAHDGLNWWFEWGAADDLWTMRIDPAGNVLDPGGVQLPITIGGTVNNAYAVQIVPRPGGGTIVAWHDSRPSLGNDSNVFVLPVSAGNAPGSEMCASTGTTSQRQPELAPGPGSTSALVFVSEAANDDRVLVQFVDAGGGTLPVEPVEVYRGPTVGRAGIAFNGSLYLVAFDTGASGLTPIQIKARRMNPDGSFVDPQPFDVMPGFNAAVGALGEDFLVAGARYASNPQFISLVANRIDGPTGALLDGPSGLNLGGGYVSGAPRVRSDSTRWLVAAHSMWTHNSSQGDAILTFVPPIGPPSPIFNPTPFAGGTGDLDIACSGSSYLLAWRNNTLSNANNFIAGRIMNSDGSFATGAFTIAEAAGRQLRPVVGWDGSTYIVAWEDQRNQGAFFDARTESFAARVTEAGAVLDPGAFVVATRAPGQIGGIASPTLLPRDGWTLCAQARFTTDGTSDSYRIGLTAIGALPEPCYADCEQDGDLDVFDFLCFQGAFAAQQAFADCEGDGDWDVFDFLCFQGAFAGGCP